MIRLFLNLFLAVVLIATDNVDLWGLLLLLWANVLLYAVASIKQRAYLAAFFISFFIFLLSRDTLERVFKYAPISVNPLIENDVAILLGLGLTGVIIGYVLTSTIKKGSSRLLTDDDSKTVLSRTSLAQAALGVYYITLPGAYIGLIQNILFVRRNSYTGLYTSEYVQATGGVAATLFSYSGQIAFVAFCVYLATLPNYKSARFPLALWIGYSGLFLFTGRRRDLAILLLFVICYAIVRNRITPHDPWVTPGKIRAAVIALPALVLVFAGLEAWRGLGSSTAGIDISVATNFLYGQGVSVTVIQNIVSWQHLLPDQVYLVEFAQQGFIPRILGNPVLEGNTVERATQGGSLAHSLSYIVLGPNTYTSGVSTGTSFIAEAFIDLGKVGVFLVSTVFGALIAFLDRLGNGGLRINIVRLLMVQSILWAPRGSATGFISMLIAPSTLFALAGIYVLSLLVRKTGEQRVTIHDATKFH